MGLFEGLSLRNLQLILLGTGWVQLLGPLRALFIITLITSHDTKARGTTRIKVLDFEAAVQVHPIYTAASISSAQAAPWLRGRAWAKCCARRRPHTIGSPYTAPYGYA